MKGFKVDGTYYLCFICYQECLCPMAVIDTLWDDNLWFGRPICSECANILRVLRPKQVNYEKPRPRPRERRIGIEKFL